MKKTVNDISLRWVPWRIRRAIRALWTPTLEEFPDAPDIFYIYRDLCRHPDLMRKPGGWLYKGRFYPDYLTVGGASPAIYREALKWCKGTGADVGAGLWPLPGAQPFDAQRGEGAGQNIRDIKDDSLDFVFSSHCMEHIPEWQNSLREWVGKVKVGGIVFLYLPHPDCAIWHPGSPFVGDGHKWAFTPTSVKTTLQELGCEVVSSDDGPDGMQSFCVCAQKN